MTARLPPGAPRKRAPAGSPERTVTQQVRLRADEQAAWRAEARARGITVSELVREAMRLVAPVKKAT